MSSLPEGYKAQGFAYGPRQPARTDAQKQAAHWREHNQALSEKNAARGRALQEKNGNVPTLSDVYAASRAENKAAYDARQAEIEASPYSFVNRLPSSMLPPNDPIRQEFKRKHFGLPTHEAEMARLQAERDALQADYNKLQDAIMGVNNIG